MSGRGGRKRGRPPKTPNNDRNSKFNYQLLKKPKYLMKGSDSQFSTPTVSRASSPQESDGSRRSASRPSTTKSVRGRGRRGGLSTGNASFSSRKGYESEYHYGSDFGDSSEKSEAEDDLLPSPSEEESVDGDAESDSDFSANSFGPSAGVGRPPRVPSPDPIWLQDRDVPLLFLPMSSDDLFLTKEHSLKAVSIYEVLRRFRNLVRLSPFRLEDFCAALISEEQSALLTDIHIMLLKTILREEDVQATHFGPLDQKDSVNICLYLIDSITWPEVLRSYVESDISFDRKILHILSSKEYPFIDIDDRLSVLQFLTDQFLITTSVRDDLLQEGPIHYDDHCRICHRLGDLLCCETCPAVFHLECVDPPLVDVPTEDWQCNLCKSHKVIGVVDCVSSQEKQGLLIRHEILGVDRHGRKYWFVGRRIFVEDQEGQEVWYYSTIAQLKLLLSKLDEEEFEKQLCKEISDLKDEIMRQMQITENLTNEQKGNKKSYFEVENEKIEKENVESETNSNSSELEDKLKSNSETRLTRNKSNQISTGTLYYKIGMDNAFKTYTNQYSTNPIALNKPQRNEDRDKKRHLSHKFSLTTASEFKWMGGSNSTEASLISTLRHTILSLEQSMSAPFMNTNWVNLRKIWINAVTSCVKPKDFANVLLLLQACLKGVVYANVWHEQLGHIKLQRITSIAREEKKKIEKREKREKDDEEERNRLSCNYIKYSLGLKHQVWKQKGEEYRIHGQWGWIWMSYSRRILKKYRTIDKILPIKILMRIKRENDDGIIAVDPRTFAFLKQCEERTKMGVDYGYLEDYKGTEIIQIPQIFDTIDVSNALTSKSRLFYPKIARKSKLDDLLTTRIKLKETEEQLMLSSIGTKEKDVDVVNDVDHDSSNLDVKATTTKFVKQYSLEKQILKLAGSKVNGQNCSNQSTVNYELVNSLAKKIQSVRVMFSQLNRFAKQYRCYAKGCNTNSNAVSQITQNTCYSSLCLQKARAKKELLLLLRKAHTVGNGSKETVAAILGAVKKPSILEQKLMEGKKDNSFADDNEDRRLETDCPLDLQQDFKNALANSITCDEKTLLSCVTITKEEIKYESIDECAEVTVKSEEEDSKPNVSNLLDVVSNENAMDIDLHCNSDDKTVSDSVNDCLKTEENKNDIRNSDDIESSNSQFDLLEDDVSTVKRTRKSQRSLNRTNAATPKSNKSNDNSLDISLNKSTKMDVENHVTKQKYEPKPNRRFPINQKLMKKEEAIKYDKEYGPNGKERIYSAKIPRGKVYLLRGAIKNSLKRNTSKSSITKFPLLTNFVTHKLQKSILVIPQYELLKLSRNGGKSLVSGFHHLAKMNNAVWPYPCSRPLFKYCWLYRTINCETLSSIALQFRILWCCLRWDDLITKPPTTDGKHQITTETEIVTLELLKLKYLGRFSERTQYLRRKVVIPLELPKTIREVTSIRSGLRKRKRAESPQQTEPQVTEEWVEEDKLELWEIKLFGEKQEKTVTRTLTGKLPPPKQHEIQSSSSINSNTTGTTSHVKNVSVSIKVSPDEIKEKMEQQLKLQRAAHQQKKAMDIKPQPVVTKPNIIGNRRVIVKNADGTTKIIHHTITAPTPKAPVVSSATVAQNTNSAPAQHKVQIIRGPDGKVSVRGLSPGQQLIQMPDGKLHVLTSTPGSANKTVALKSTNTASPGKAVINKIPTIQQVIKQPVIVKQVLKQTSGSPVAVKQVIQQKTSSPKVVVTSNQLIAPAITPKQVPTGSSNVQKIMTNNQLVATNLQGQKIVTTAGNLQQILAQSGQKIIVGQNAQGQKVLISSQATQSPQQQQIIVQNAPQNISQQQQQQQQQQIILNPINQGTQKVVQQIVNTSNTQQQIVVGGQRILLSPGQTIVTQRSVPQSSQTSQQQVQVVQQQIIQPAQHQQLIQSHVLVQNPTTHAQQQTQSVITQQSKPKTQTIPQSTVQQPQSLQNSQQNVQTIQPQVQSQQQQQQQQSSQQQIVVQNSALAQQLAQGKLQVATVNGQQVIIKPIGNNQAQVVAHIKTQSDGSAHIVTNMSFTENESTTQVNQTPPKATVAIQQRNQTATVVQKTQAIQQSNVQSVPISTQMNQHHTQLIQQQSTQLVQQQQQNVVNSIEQSLLQGQPPGTVIKCVTAQVIQTEHGPRIVLQGLAGNDFTQQQLALVQQQVKQQLLKAQESSGKQGVLGPTKIYLAVQPSNNTTQQTSQVQPPPLTPVQTSPQQQIKHTSMLSANKIDETQNKQKFNGAPDSKNEVLQKTMNKKILVQNVNLNFETGPKDQNRDSFIVTPDYIQQSIKNALKQQNLNPEIEEKLLNLQRYQEQQMKDCPAQILNSNENIVVTTNNVTPTTPVKSNSSKKRPYSKGQDDDDWILETPKKRTSRQSGPSSFMETIKHNEQLNQNVSPELVTESATANSVSQTVHNRKNIVIKKEVEKKKPHYQLNNRLCRQKELLKKDILKKRILLEKELQIEIQKELTVEINQRKQTNKTLDSDTEQQNYNANAKITTTNKIEPPADTSNKKSDSSALTTSTPSGKTKKSLHKISNTPGSSRKKEKLYCICRTIYDDTKFYVGCDLCNNWFHGDCVGITEEASKKLSEFICDECKHARDTQELYCLCKQPYDESQFYICCDKCQDWFHGRCVGILQSEAEFIDEYICPNCQRNNSVNFANLKNLSRSEYDELKKLIKQIQAHKSAWPFMEPVDPDEAPDYYKVIKDPMDLQKVDSKITNQAYTKLSEFIGDMTKIFDNCRYYNPKESQFYKCAESLEAYFVQKIKNFRDNLVDPK